MFVFVKDVMNTSKMRTGILSRRHRVSAPGDLYLTISGPARILPKLSLVSGLGALVLGIILGYQC